MIAGTASLSSVQPHAEQRDVFEPRIGFNPEALKAFENSSSPELALAFRVKTDVCLGRVLTDSAALDTYASSLRDSEFQKIQDAAQQLNLKLILLRVDGSDCEGVIVRAEREILERGSLRGDNLFKHDIPDMPRTIPHFNYPAYELRSIGAACRSVSDSAHFPTRESAERYLEIQRQNGFRGWVVLQGHFKLSVAVSCPFLAEYQVGDSSVEQIAEISGESFSDALGVQKVEISDADRRRFNYLEDPHTAPDRNLNPASMPSIVPHESWTPFIQHDGTGTFDCPYRWHGEPDPERFRSSLQRTAYVTGQPVVYGVDALGVLEAFALVPQDENRPEPGSSENPYVSAIQSYVQDLRQSEVERMAGLLCVALGRSSIWIKYKSESPVEISSAAAS